MARETNSGYKRTKIGRLPGDWVIHKLGKYITLVSGQHIKAKDYNENGKGIPYLTGPIDYPNGRINASKFAEKPKVVCDKHDILITCKGSGTGAITLADNNYCISRQIMAIRTKSIVSNYYIYTYLKSKQAEFNRKAVGLIPGIGRGEIQNLLVPLPPLPEQRKIAQVLSTWDKAIELTEKLIAAKERRKKGLMQQLLTGKQRFAEFLDQNWKTVKVGKLGQIFKGKGISKSEVRSTGLPCIRYGELYTRYNYYFNETYSFCDGVSATQSREVQNGDILFAGSGETADEIGKCAVYIGNDTVYAGGDIIILRPNTQNSLFLSFVLNHDIVTKQKSVLGQGHSVVHIYPKDIAELKVPIPALNEQTRIANVLLACDREINLLRKRVVFLKQQKKGLMQKLLTGRIRVKTEHTCNAKRTDGRKL